jgi:YD repeat-containing protein
LGYLDVTDPKRPIHFSGTGLATIFIRPEQAAADAPYISEFKLLGDHRNLSLISGEYRLTEPDGAYTIFSAATQRVIYPIQRVNADGKTVWIASYVNGVPKEIKDYRGGTTTYTTDSATGLVTSVTTADGASYQLSYDTQKRLVMVSRFGQMLIKASYQGNTLTEVRDQSGLTSLFSYRDGRLEALNNSNLRE